MVCLFTFSIVSKFLPKLMPPSLLLLETPSFHAKQNPKFFLSGNFKFLVKWKPQLSTTPVIIYNTMQPSTLPKVMVRPTCLFPNSVCNVVQAAFVVTTITLYPTAITTTVATPIRT
jgi:hypothetical protein